MIAASPTPNVKYVPAENTVAITGIRKVAIFPFADYSHQQDNMGVDTWGGNIKIQEEITDHLVAHGLTIAVQEDVNTVLVDQDIIRPIDKEKYLMYGTVTEEDKNYKKIGTPEYELTQVKHSFDMANEIKKIVDLGKQKDKTTVSHTPVLQGATVGLTKEKIVEIAQILGVDMIIRGRIIDYGYKDVGTMNPLYRGFVPVAIDSVKDLLWGATNSYGYEDDLEDIENILIGGGLGYVIGNSIISRSTHHSSGISGGLISRRTSSEHSSTDDYGLQGAAIGAASGWLASQHPKKAKRSAVVQVRIYAQNAETGDVLWSNRVEIEYTPKSNFAYDETHPKAMFDKAVKEGVKALMDSFFAESQNALQQKNEPVQTQKEGA
ncbi:MAG: hypothetical protein WCQ99_07100 [Pseudomonadota bacterium]